jgi:hypothetical protein
MTALVLAKSLVIVSRAVPISRIARKDHSPHPLASPPKTVSSGRSHESIISMFWVGRDRYVVRNTER